jgi:hypothetical protein
MLSAPPPQIQPSRETAAREAPSQHNQADHMNGEVSRHLPGGDHAAAFRRIQQRSKNPAYLSGGGLSSAAMGNSAGGPWACWIRRCARAPGLTSVRDPRVGSGVGDEMFDGVIPLGEALRPLDLSRRSTRMACRQRVFGSWPRRIGVSEGLTRAEGWKLVFGSSGQAGTGCRIARPKPGSSGQGIGALAGCRGLGRGWAAA